MTTKTDEFADHLFQAALGTFEILAIHLGDRLGWYRALAERRARPTRRAGRAHRLRRAVRTGVAGAAGRGRASCEVRSGRGRFAAAGRSRPRC